MFLTTLSRLLLGCSPRSSVIPESPLDALRHLYHRMPRRAIRPNAAHIISVSIAAPYFFGKCSHTTLALFLYQAHHARGFLTNFAVFGTGIFSRRLLLKRLSERPNRPTLPEINTREPLHPTRTAVSKEPETDVGIARSERHTPSVSKVDLIAEKMIGRPPPEWY